MYTGLVVMSRTIYSLSSSTLDENQAEDFNHLGQYQAKKRTRTNAELHVRQLGGYRALRCHNSRKPAGDQVPQLNICIKGGVPEL
jgi:hypothetical protein